MNIDGKKTQGSDKNNVLLKLFLLSTQWNYSYLTDKNRF